MAEQDFKRKLTAILSADVEGYSLLMRDDEEATVRTLTTYRKAITKLIQQYRGRLVDATGDNLLSEFTSVVDAVNCAVEIQRELAERNAELPENRRMQFRIGINLGDVVEEGERIYGDGVNIAARMEGLAEGGGVCISGKVYEEVKNKLGLEYEYLGEQEVKNITEPVRVYRVLSYPGAAVHRVVKAKKAVSKTWRNVLVGVAVVLVVGTAVAIWNFYLRSAPPVEVASIEKMAYPLPGKPSIAVLPFVNMSDDPKQEYFSDGLTDQIISGLSKVPYLFVIARNSSFTYKGKPVKVQKVAEDLGVKYVLEGSVQKTADRIRITAQLIDATTGHHLWSERYDRNLEDIFAIQDDITMEIMKAMQVMLTRGEQARVWAKHETTNLAAYEKSQEGRAYILRYMKEDNAQGRQLLEEAIDLDTGFASAYAMIGWTHFLDARFGWTESRAKSAKMALEYAQKALEMDDTIDYARTLLSAIYLVKRQHEKAVAEAERALALNPNSAHVLGTLAGVSGCSGRWEESIVYFKKSIRLEPFPPINYLTWLGRAYFMTGQHDEAIPYFKKALDRNPNYLPAHAFLAASYSSLGRETEAVESAEQVLRINPKFAIKLYAKTLPYKNKTDIERYIAALRKAGLPDTPPLPLPDKPSIAVLPFDNLSDDPKQEYFSDGLSEQIIVNLSKLPDLFVIARNSTFSYKGKPVKVQQVSKELGVRYVLEGSVQKSGDRVRITAQLVDAITGHHLWAERYDRDLRDIFALQDEITKKILLALQVKLTRGESARVYGRNTDNLEAYLKYLQALHHQTRTNQEGNILARELCEEAIALEPNYADAFRTLAVTHLWDVWFGWSKSTRESFKQAETLAQKSLALDNTNALTVGLMGHIYLLKRQHDKAIAEGERAIALSPNLAYGYMLLAATYRFSGRAKEGIPLLEKAIRLQPYAPSSYLYHLGMVYNFTGRYDEAIAVLKKALKRTPDHLLSLLGLTIAYSLADRMEEARATAAEVLRVNPKFSVAYQEKKTPYKHKADLELSMGAMRKAGLK